MVKEEKQEYFKWLFNNGIFWTMVVFYTLFSENITGSTAEFIGRFLGSIILFGIPFLIGKVLYNKYPDYFKWLFHNWMYWTLVLGYYFLHIILNLDSSISFSSIIYGGFFGSIILFGIPFLIGKVLYEKFKKR